MWRKVMATHVDDYNSGHLRSLDLENNMTRFPGWHSDIGTAYSTHERLRSKVVPRFDPYSYLEPDTWITPTLNTRSILVK